jgi:hypothetical protein
MCRSIPSFLALSLMLSLVATSSVSAGPPPTGTVSCAVAGQLSFGFKGLPTAINTDPPRTTMMKIKDAEGNLCDASGVTGGRFPITGALVSLRGRLVEGETCADFFGTLDFKKTKLGVKWRGLNAYGRLQTVASSKATVVSAVYDSGSEKVVIVTEPIARGAFAGSTLTFRLGVGADANGPASFEDNCNDVDGAFSRVAFGGDGTTTIAVP